LFCLLLPRTQRGPAQQKNGKKWTPNRGIGPAAHSPQAISVTLQTNRELWWNPRAASGPITKAHPAMLKSEVIPNPFKTGKRPSGRANSAPHPSRQGPPGLAVRKCAVSILKRECHSRPKKKEILKNTAEKKAPPNGKTAKAREKYQPVTPDRTGANHAVGPVSVRIRNRKTFSPSAKWKYANVCPLPVETGSTYRPKLPEGIFLPPVPRRTPPAAQECQPSTMSAKGKWNALFWPGRPLFHGWTANKSQPLQGEHRQSSKSSWRTANHSLGPDPPMVPPAFRLAITFMPQPAPPPC